MTKSMDKSTSDLIKLLDSLRDTSEDNFSTNSHLKSEKTGKTLQNQTNLDKTGERNYSELRNTLLSTINYLRNSKNLKSLKSNEKLNRAAQSQADGMAESDTITRKTSVQDELLRVEYFGGAGENVAKSRHSERNFTLKKKFDEISEKERIFGKTPQKEKVLKKKDQLGWPINILKIWLGSPLHARNIMGDWQDIGVGVCTRGEWDYTVLLVGQPNQKVTNQKKIESKSESSPSKSKDQTSRPSQRAEENQRSEKNEKLTNSKDKNKFKFVLNLDKLKDLLKNGNSKSDPETKSIPMESTKQNERKEEPNQNKIDIKSKKTNQPVDSENSSEHTKSNSSDKSKLKPESSTPIPFSTYILNMFKDPKKYKTGEVDVLADDLTLSNDSNQEGNDISTQEKPKKSSNENQDERKVDENSSQTSEKPRKSTNGEGTLQNSPSVHENDEKNEINDSKNSILTKVVNILYQQLNSLSMALSNHIKSDEEKDKNALKREEIEKSIDEKVNSREKEISASINERITKSINEELNNRQPGIESLLMNKVEAEIEQKHEEMDNTVNKKIENEIKDLKDEISREIKTDLETTLKTDLKEEIEMNLKEELQKDLKDDLRKELAKDLQTSANEKLQNGLKEEIQKDLKNELKEDLKTENEDLNLKMKEIKDEMDTNMSTFTTTFNEMINDKVPKVLSKVIDEKEAKTSKKIKKELIDTIEKKINDVFESKKSAELTDNIKKEIEEKVEKAVKENQEKTQEAQKSDKEPKKKEIKPKETKTTEKKKEKKSEGKAEHPDEDSFSDVIDVLDKYLENYQDKSEKQPVKNKKGKLTNEQKNFTKRANLDIPIRYNPFNLNTQSTNSMVNDLCLKYLTGLGNPSQTNQNTDDLESHCVQNAEKLREPTYSGWKNDVQVGVPIFYGLR